jgi:hypothetical protein
MTPLQDTYLAKLHATASANLEFFRLNLPEVYQLLVKENPAPSLDISDQGDLTIRYPDGSTRPVAAHMVETEWRFAEFADPETRPQLLAFHNLRRVQEDPSHGDMQRYHYSNLDAEFPNRVRRHFAEHYPDNKGLSRYPMFGPDNRVPLLLVLGSGAGVHLSRLMLEYDVGHMIVMEADVDAFRLSLFFQDYVQLSRLAVEKGTDLGFIVGSDTSDLSRGLMRVLHESLPPFFVHGAALFYAMPEGDTLEAIKASITETLWQLFFGLGYFDDELISVCHTFQNLKNSQLPIYIKPRVVPEDAVAFVVGSGPSLDALLPLLEQHGGRAVVFSCGTALGPLAHAGIAPDFHLEKERPGIVYEVLTKTVPEAFRKQVHFLGLNVVMPEVFGLFGDATMVLKEVDTMGFVLEQSGQVSRIPLDTQPTVTNMAVSIALSLGFKHVYLLGVDMGYREKDQHHSKHTAYLGKMPEAEHLRRLLSKRPAMEKVVPANFGGEAITNNILDVARLHLEHTIRLNPRATLYNLNDGALIKGAQPLPPDEFPDLGGRTDKNAVLGAIRSAFQCIDVDPEPVRKSLLAQVDEFIEEVRSIVDRDRRSRMQVIDTIVRIYRHLMSEVRKDTPPYVLFRGTLLMLMSLTYNAISIIEDEDEAVAKAEYDFGNLMDCLEHARSEVARVAFQPVV